MQDVQRKAWFAPKRYGYGAGMPITWQGWVSGLLFTAISASPWLMLGRALPDRHHAVGAIGLGALVDAVALATFSRVCRPRTVGGWRWRWGGGD